MKQKNETILKSLLLVFALVVIVVVMISVLKKDNQGHVVPTEKSPAAESNAQKGSRGNQQVQGPTPEQMKKLEALPIPDDTGQGIENPKPDPERLNNLTIPKDMN